MSTYEIQHDLETGVSTVSQEGDVFFKDRCITELRGHGFDTDCLVILSHATCAGVAAKMACDDPELEAILLNHYRALRALCMKRGIEQS